jgi:glutamyl-tRNA synthetase
MTKKRRTRFAPSPTGYMHIGNLRSALYTWLISKSQGGDFILRIEDTDQERLVEGAVQVIYDTLEMCGLDHDEGPDVGGPCGPYIQSQRLDHYRPYAEKLIKEGRAYPCFCSKERLESLAEGADGQKSYGYDRHCRNIDPAEAQKRIEAGEPYVIRQKMPLEGETTFHDLVYGDITVKNEELEDQILIKADGYPTYNFANVIDDHEMGITHVVRGSEYLSSAPKYNLLYEALGFEIPEYVHLPLILGTDGKKLSKRHGATSFQDLIKEGYLVDAIVNYIAFLGWSPGSDTREFFTLEELRQVFNEHNISHSPAVFDYQKLDWYNAHYLQELEPEVFQAWLEPKTDAFFGDQYYNLPVLAEVLQTRVSNYQELPEMLAFFKEVKPYDLELFSNKKQKLTPELSAEILQKIKSGLEALPEFTREQVHALLMGLGPDHGWKTGQVMAPVRWALSGQTVTPGGGTELIMILGQEESLKRMEQALALLSSQA